MATTIDELLVRLDADVSGLKGELKKAERQTEQSSKKMEGAFGDLNSVIGKVGGVLAGLGVAMGATDLVRQILTVSGEVKALESTLTAATGSLGAAEEAMMFVRKEAERLGLDVATAGASFGKLAAAARGTALEGQAARDIFVAVSEAGTALGLTASEVEGALNAIQQMISKGTVQAEELRGQLGERLPGAFQVAAKAMGATTRELGKMLELGEVSAEDMLPKLAAALRETYGPQAEKMSSSYRAEMNRLSNAWRDLLVVLGESGVVSAITAAIVELTDAIDFLAGGMNVAQERAEVLRARYSAFGRQIADVEEQMAVFHRMLEAGRISEEGHAQAIELLRSKIKGLEETANDVRLRSLRAELAFVEEIIERLLKPFAGDPNAVPEAVDKQIQELERKAKFLKENIELSQQSAGATEKDADATNKSADAQKALNKILDAQRNKLDRLTLSEDELLEKRIRSVAASDAQAEAALRQARAIQAEINAQEDLNRLFEEAVAQDEANKEAAKERAQARKEAAQALFDEAQALRESLNPAEALDTALQRLDHLLAEGAISWETYGEAVFRELDRVESETKQSTDQMSEFAKQAARSMEGAFSNFFFNAMQGKFNDMAGSFKQTIDRMVADLLASQLLNYLLGDFGTTGKLGGVIEPAVSALFGGGGAQTGADFTVGGVGGADSQLVAFRATPGERVTVDSPAHPRHSQMRGGVSVVNNVTVQAPGGRVAPESLQQLQTTLGLGVRRALAKNA